MARRSSRRRARSATAPTKRTAARRPTSSASSRSTTSTPIRRARCAVTDAFVAAANDPRLTLGLVLESTRRTNGYVPPVLTSVWARAPTDTPASGRTSSVLATKPSQRPTRFLVHGDAPLDLEKVGLSTGDPDTPPGPGDYVQDGTQDGFHVSGHPFLADPRRRLTRRDRVPEDALTSRPAARSARAAERRPGRAGLAEHVLGGVEPLHPSPEPPGGVGPEGGVSARLVDVPAGAAARAPDGACPALVGVRDELRLRFGARLHGRDAGARACSEARSQVRDLALDHVDDRRVPEPRVRPEEEEEIRKPGHGRPEVRLRAAVPRARRACGRRACHVLAERKIRHVEARAEDDRVDRVLLAVRVTMERGAHLPDACR